MSTIQDEDGDVAGDLLVGASAIAAYLTFLGWPDPDPYYLRRAGRLSIGSTAENGRLVASKRRLRRETQGSN
ncbi:MAG: hypothetical protein ABWZ64_01320 [Xanthobacteraceae bacterium]|jgi:hypothetical protein